MRGLPDLLDILLGWKAWRSGAVSTGADAAVVWRRIRHVAGNRLSVGQNSIIQANIRFEDRGGEIRIGDRSYVGKSDLVCYRSIVIGNRKPLLYTIHL